MIKFTVPYLDISESQAVGQALIAGDLVGDGPVCRRVEAKLRELTGARYAMLTTSCTHALELALLALGVGEGDEVILPSFTFSSTANAIVRAGARPVFAEVRLDTLNIDADDVARRISPRTRALLPVHYAGVACDMDALNELARQHNLLVVEDAAQGIGARYRGRPLGALGHAGCYSFHTTKNVVCGEGGALLLDDEAVAHRAEIIREKGTNRKAFLRGEVDKYTWVEVGSSFVLSDLLATVLEVQLAKLEEITALRQRAYRYYAERLQSLADRGLVTLPHVPVDCETNYHIFFIRVNDEETRNACLAALKAQGVQATFHYVPLHSSPYGRSAFGYRPDDLPITEQVSRTLIRLPLYPSLTQTQQDVIIEALKSYFQQATARQVK